MVKEITTWSLHLDCHYKQLKRCANCSLLFEHFKLNKQTERETQQSSHVGTSSEIYKAEAFIEDAGSLLKNTMGNQKITTGMKTKIKYFSSFFFIL